MVSKRCRDEERDSHLHCGSGLCHVWFLCAEHGDRPMYGNKDKQLKQLISGEDECGF